MYIEYSLPVSRHKRARMKTRGQYLCLSVCSYVCLYIRTDIVSSASPIITILHMCIAIHDTNTSTEYGIRPPKVNVAISKNILMLTLLQHFRSGCIQTDF